MIIHQIFLKVSDKTLEDFPCYIEGIKIWKEFCKKHNWEYKLWTDIPQDILDEDDIYILQQSKGRHPFIPVDYMRLIVLKKYGGMYVDLDVTPKDKFKEIMNNKIIIGCGDNVVSAKERTTHNSNVIKLPHHYYLSLKKFCVKTFKRLIQIPIYDTWKIRFYLRSVSAPMLDKFLKPMNIPIFNDFEDYFEDKMTSTWDTPALKKQLKKITPVITNMSEIKTIKIFSTDDCVKMTGGKCKGCEGTIVKVMKLFCSVRITKDKKGQPVFSDKPSKVKRDHIVIVEPTPLEMPSGSDLKVVDDLEPTSNLIDYIDQKLAQESKVETVPPVEDIVEEVKPTLIDEKGVRGSLPSIDDCINLRDENRFLKLQVESLISWQSHASAECAKFKKEVEDLKKQMDSTAVKYRKDELIDLIKNL